MQPLAFEENPIKCFIDREITIGLEQGDGLACSVSVKTELILNPKKLVLVINSNRICSFIIFKYERKDQLMKITFLVQMLQELLNPDWLTFRKHEKGLL